MATFGQKANAKIDVYISHSPFDQKRSYDECAERSRMRRGDCELRELAHLRRDAVQMVPGLVSARAPSSGRLKFRQLAGEISNLALLLPRPERIPAHSRCEAPATFESDG